MWQANRVNLSANANVGRMAPKSPLLHSVACEYLLYEFVAPVKDLYITPNLHHRPIHHSLREIVLYSFMSPAPRLPPSSAPEDHASHYSSSYGQPTDNSNPNQSFFRNLVINQCSQAARLEIGWLVIK